MPRFLIDISDRHGIIESVEYNAKDSIDARMNIYPNDKKLCRNSYVVLENTPFYERQIVNITPV